MENATIITIRLTQEELAVLYQHATTLPVGQMPYTDLLSRYSETQWDLIIEVARRGLVARQLLEPDGDGSHNVHPLALAIIGGSLLAEHSVVILTQTSIGEIGSIEFHAYAEEIYLAQSVLPDDLHEFDIFVDETVYRQAILKSLNLRAPVELTCRPCKLTAQLFTRAVALAQEGDGAAVAVALNKLPLPEETVSELATTLSGPFEFKSITLLKHEDDTKSQGQALVFLQGNGGLWLVEAAENDEANNDVLLQPLSASESLAKVEALISLS